LLRPVTVKQTPDLSFDNSAALAQFINTSTSGPNVPLNLPFPPATPFLGAFAHAANHWNAPGILSNDKRHAFSLNTCDGCHSNETGTGFLHVSPAPFGFPASLSGFLTGTTVSDPVSGVPRSFNDLANRSSVLANFATASCRPFFDLPIISPALPFKLPFPPIALKPTIASH
jgi:hypothetical protein